MKQKWVPAWVPALAVAALTQFLPAAAADNRHGIGLAVVSGAADCDSCNDAIEFTGYSLFGKIGFTDNWGLMITYRDMEDNEDLFLSEEDTYTQVAVQAVYMWRPTKVMRPHVKFGVERTDLEGKIPGFATVSDDDTTLAVGGGFEAGSQKVAFLLDYDFTLADIFDEDFAFANLNLGIIFKF
jgi:hypothetical protein